MHACAGQRSVRESRNRDFGYPYFVHTRTIRKRASFFYCLPFAFVKYSLALALALILAFADKLCHARTNLCVRCVLSCLSLSPTLLIRPQHAFV